MDLNAALYDGWNDIIKESYTTHHCRLFFILLSAYAVVTNAFIVLVISRFEELHSRRCYVYISRTAWAQIAYYGMVQAISVFAHFMPVIPSKRYCYINFITVLLLIMNSILVQMTAVTWMLEAKFQRTVQKHGKCIYLALDFTICIYVLFDVAIFGLSCNESNNLLEAYVLTIPVTLFVNIVYKLRKSDPIDAISVMPLVVCYIFITLWLPSFIVYLLSDAGFDVIDIKYYNLEYWVTFLGYSNGGIILSVLYIFDETFRKYLRVCLKSKETALWEANAQTEYPV